MSAKTFVDTNVLIYAHDEDAGTKHRTARGVLRELWGRRTGVLSAQVLQEFYVNVTRKIATPLPKPSARGVVDNYVVWCVETTPADISAAFRIEDEARIGFWDALIIAAARKAGADRILSEDLNAGQIIAGVQIENPFSMEPGNTAAPSPRQDFQVSPEVPPDDEITTLITRCYRAVTPEELSKIRAAYKDSNDLKRRLEDLVLHQSGATPEVSLGFFLRVLQK